MIYVPKYSVFHSCDIIQTDNFGYPANNTPHHTKYNGIMALFELNKIQSLAHGTIMIIERMKYVDFTGELFPFR